MKENIIKIEKQWKTKKVPVPQGAHDPPALQNPPPPQNPNVPIVPNTP